MSAPKIRFDKVTKRYGELTVLDGLDLDIAPGEVVAVIGPSGSGKTTVLRVLMTLEKINDGVIWIDGEPMNRMRQGDALVPASRAHVRKLRAKIGMVFQGFNLFPHMTVLGNCIEAPIHSLGLSRAEAVARAQGLLARVGLADKQNHYPSQLSGGQQQRVAIARALMQNPKMLLADEPIASLDPLNAKIVMDALRDINEREGITVITNLHTLDTARAYCERIIGMSAGRVVFDGPAHALDADAVRTIYGTAADGAEIDESLTSTAIRNPARQDNTKESAGPTPLALVGL